MIKVTVRNSTVVQPSQETPKQCLWTSNIDQLFRMHLPTIYIYKPNVANYTDCSNNFFDTSVLKESLSKVLVSFYPVSGRLRPDEDRFWIDCGGGNGGGGVEFIEAQTDSVLDDLGDFAPNEKLKPLLPQLGMSDWIMQNKELLDNDNEFWDLVACLMGYIGIYHISYIHKEPCMTSYLTGELWMNELLNGHEKRCFNMFRMNQITFRQLCMDLESIYGLKPSDRMSVLEKVGMFVYTISKGASNRDLQERFQHSGETVSRVFKEVLDAIDGFSRDILRPRDPNFKEIPSQIANDSKYMPHFKDCIGAIDGTHISVIIPEEDQMRYKGRKGIPTTNVLAACDFDLLFTYVLTGWEGSAHDARIFLDTINNPSLNFPKPPPGKYYLADKGYPDREGYLTPYSKIRYHQSEFRGANARGHREIFNLAHSSLRSCIERAFGILKARWKILSKMPRYSFEDQNRIICAAFALHNYIRRSTIGDPAFKIIDEDPDFIPPDVLADVEGNSTQEYVEERRARNMSIIRDNITSSLMAARRRS